METFTDCPVRSYRRHTVLAVVFAPLAGANPCSLSNATVRRMLLFRLTAAALSTVGGRNHEVPCADPGLPTLDSFSFELVTSGFVHERFKNDQFERFCG